MTINEMQNSVNGFDFGAMFGNLSSNSSSESQQNEVTFDDLFPGTQFAPAENTEEAVETTTDNTMIDSLINGEPVQVTKGEELTSEGLDEDKAEEPEQSEENGTEENVTEEDSETAEKEKKEEIKPVRKRRRKRNNIDTPKVEEGDNDKTEDGIVYMPINPNATFDNIIGDLGFLPSEAFLDVIDDIEKKMNAIRIERHLDSANINLMLDRIDELSNIIYASYAETKTVKEGLIDKETGLIHIVKKRNTYGEGTVADREIRGLEACMHYKTPVMENEVNLFQLAWSANYQYNFLQSMIEQLEMKRRNLKALMDSATVKAKGVTL